MNTKLRVGILVDSYLVPCWVFKMLERINGSSYAELVLVVKNDTPPLPSNPWYRRIRHNFRGLLYAAFTRLEDALSKPQPDAFKKRDLHELVSNVPCIDVEPIERKYSDYFQDSDVETIRSYDVDVLIRLGFRILRGKVLTCTRYGVWSYHHGDNLINRGGPPGFWEVFGGWSETGSALQVLTEDLDGGRVLSRSYSRTNYRSVKRNKNELYWKSLSMLPRKLNELYESGEESFAARIEADNRHPLFYSRRLHVSPKNAEMILFGVRYYPKYALRRFQEFLYHEQWILLFSLGTSTRSSSSLWRFKKIIPPRDRFWADPFVIQKGGKYYVFIEEFLFKANKGHISYLTIDEGGEVSVPKKIIEKPYHMSYPFVFSHEGNDYMVPETSRNHRVELYRCVAFPEKWEPVAVLMRDVWAVDPTLLWQDGIWWLFVNLRENEGASSLDELFLFYSSDLFSDRWTPHPQNPIVSDVKSSRPAGRVFSKNGSLYRPSQDNSKRYGYGVRINQIVRLTPKEYEEKCVNYIEPLWDRRIVAVHTMNCAGNLTVVDGMRRIAKHLG